MTALAVRVPQLAPLSWPRIGAWSGSLSLHIFIALVLLVPAAAIRIVRHAQPQQVVQIIAPPEPAKPIPALPTPVKPTPRIHTPALAIAVPAIVTPPSDMAVFVPQVVPSMPTHATPVAMDSPPSAIAYGKRTQVAYPREALRNHQQGTVVLRVLVGADGAVQSVEIEKTSGSRSLDRAAREAVMKWSFHPAMRNGLAHAEWASVPITFNLHPL
jgi:protein TonB